jgi:hypothetical protein
MLQAVATHRLLVTMCVAQHCTLTNLPKMTAHRRYGYGNDEATKGPEPEWPGTCLTMLSTLSLRQAPSFPCAAKHALPELWTAGRILQVSGRRCCLVHHCLAVMLRFTSALTHCTVSYFNAESWCSNQPATCMPRPRHLADASQHPGCQRCTPCRNRCAFAHSLEP